MTEQTKRSAVLLLALSLVGAGAQVSAQEAAEAKAIDIAALLHEAEAAVQLAGGLTLLASSPALREGEALVLSIDLPRAGYLNVVSINPEGEPTVLFPNQAQRDNKVQAGRFALPTSQMPFDIRAAAPYGASLITVFLTETPVDLYTTGDEVRNGAGAVRSQFARWSVMGRDLISALGTKSLVVDAKAAPMLAGMTTVVTCAKTGPCEAQETRNTGSIVASGARFLHILDALAPGILLEPAGKDLQAKTVKLRPVYDKGLKLTKVSEGFVPRLYNDSARYCSIAYGHLVKKAPCSGDEPPALRGGVSEPSGSRLLVQDMARAQRAVMSMVTVPLSEGQYAALCDFTYNVGSGNFKKSTLLKAVNANQHERVPFQLRRWSVAGGREYRGLKVRRERETALYFDGEPVPKSAPLGEVERPVDIRLGEL